MVLQAVVGGYLIGFAMYVRHYEWVAAQLLFCILTPLYFQAVVQIKEAVSNPFRNDVNDFSWKVLHTRLTNECTAFYEAGACPPHAADTDGQGPAKLPAQFVVRQVSTPSLGVRGPGGPARV
mmetsp:Transcript_6665/g.23561  ORF Transcript_6665/g.23561 Transcript_6665/m.23561 type:complete len:122 (+) Transcript_6665:256-621(+)